MAVIRVGVQAPAGSAGQTVDLDGPFATVSTIANLGAESIAYSIDGGSSWTTIAASGSASPGAAIASDRLRLRKVTAGAYPIAVDVTATLTGQDDSAAALQALVSGAWKAKKAPIPAIGGPGLSAADFVVGGAGATAEVVTGPNGQPAIKLVSGVGANAELTFPGLAGSVFHGEAYAVMHGSYSQGNVQYTALLVSQADASYTNGVNTMLQSSQAATANASQEQGGAVSYWWRKGGHSNLGAGPTYPVNVGAAKLRVAPLAGQVATVYVYGFGFAAPAPKGRVCVVWDDGYDSVFKLGYDVLAARGIKQTLSVIGSAQDFGGSYSTTRQLRAFFDAGNALVTHGPWPNQGAGNLYSAYPGSTAPVADAVADMQRSRQWLADRGLLAPGAEKCYVWPQGQYQAAANDTTLLDAAIAAGFTLGRGTSRFVGSGMYQHGVQIDGMGKYNRLACPILGHLWAGDTASEATNITAITTAIQRMSAARSDGFLMLHRAVPSATNDAGMGAANNTTIRVSDLDTIAAAIATEVAAGTLEAVTMPELTGTSLWSGF